MFIKPLQLGDKKFPINIIQGPLAGVSCAPFRLLIWQYSQPAFTCTEMISCSTLIHQPLLSQRRFIKKDPSEGPVCFQLASGDPKELAEATQRVSDYGADLIDLNCGCPVKKIRSKGAGSRLLTDPIKLYQLISAMKRSTPLPVSIKIRVPDKADGILNKEIATVVSDAGADCLIVHGRHWSEHYETPCRYESIRFFVEELNIPVIGNGDVICINSLKKMFETGCAGVMIARGGVGQPWLIRKLIAEMQGEVFVLPALKEVGAVFIQHIQQLAALLDNEKFAVLQARKLAKYYARNLANTAQFCAAVNYCDNLHDFEAICSEHFVSV